MRFDCPDKILTDCGANFMFKIFLHYTNQIKVHHKFTSAFHLRTNSKSCRIHKHSTTGFSPFFLICSRTPRLPSDSLRPFMSADLSDNPQVFADDALSYLHNLWKAREDAEIWVFTNSLQGKKHWDAVMKPHSFAVGAYVLMRHKNKFGLEYNWMSPYVVVDKNSDTDVYKLTMTEGVSYTYWVHADHLKLAKDDDYTEFSFENDNQSDFLLLTKELEGT
ncbi:hypothetical protein PHYBLDRAFT_150137 [Phycomyces blakesleeanus NRRL 1555(-)]|uniref:Integrase catalytic domain-containing protein n=1 Tax=Phycomyces blakesleeanus (strain ATCC 8743b / DSM 1359 / FGSC 10004 / NBRC 33097 / NRRL 1555) TaxID=763407 RepID=A0A162NDN2_PHYB8|nr:hypothetical protein PHYBLDRAFT_150137 [Phycomyces blakesleeanus NRRL 1555(-)]OAD68544.1 hypothetical protein PHYBLDRAFT_150137 [Phycomyces blakesleeanus NRRL 1555(-)]|eukprot:XP_018286584.1 hypothetical protein PHYBLDRAFT_150137 [Phycomyces blakesleeanus NRRL 1555(-)]